jgi:predicted Zn-dependent protease
METQATLHQWTRLATLPKYSQEQEYEADEYAILILSHSGYEKPEVIYANTLQYIKNSYGDSGGGYFDYHPSTSDRINRVLGSE